MSRKYKKPAAAFNPDDHTHDWISDWRLNAKGTAEPVSASCICGAKRELTDEERKELRKLT